MKQIERRDFLKLIGVATVAPSVLAGKEPALTFRGVVLEFQRRFTNADDYERLSKGKEIRWSTVGYWWDWSSAKWVPLEKYSKNS